MPDRGKFTVVFTLPEGYRPPTEIQLQVVSESGPTAVVVKPDGSVLADPSAGWISLDGITFDTKGEPPAE